MTPLELAKERLGIARLAELRAWDWKPGKTCRIPYQPDRNESGACLKTGGSSTISRAARRWTRPSCSERVEGLSNVEACRLFIKLAGVKAGDVPHDVRLPSTARTMPHRAERRARSLSFPTSRSRSVRTWRASPRCAA
jgi:hypothetical protein